MMKRFWLQGTRVAVALAAAAALAVPASAQVVQVSGADTRNLVGFNLGYFAVKGEDSRVEGDVLLEDLQSLAFDIGDFSGFTFGGEYLFAITDYIEAGGGLGYYSKSVPSVYRGFVNADGTEIAQDLKLRVVPFNATVRFLPMGRGQAVEPYVGVGVGVYTWRYTETGEFVDFRDGSIFRDRYEADGRGFALVRVAGGWRYQSHPDVAPWVERFVLDGQSSRLSAAALETLAIVAYKQPISRAQVAAIRGVGPDGVLRNLAARGLVEEIGRDSGPGQAVLWGTTSTFLEKLGLDSLHDRPPLAAYVPDAEVVEALEEVLRVTPVEAPAPDA